MINENELQNIRGNRRLVEQMYEHGQITSEARDYALNLIMPPKRWDFIVSRFLLLLGTTLLLAGIICFFAFNWDDISSVVKLASIQIAMACAVAGAYYYSLQRIGGQLFLLAASVLVGVFLAVFGQVYQTGADTYQLFMMWSIAIFGWTIISKFIGQWVLWIIITNIFISLWWGQSGAYVDDAASMYCVGQALFYGIFLGLYEYFCGKKSFQWLNAKWLRVLLIVRILTLLAIPIRLLIFEGKPNDALIITNIVVLMVCVIMFWFYRYRRPSIQVLAALVIFACILIEIKIFECLDSFTSLLLGGISTLGIVALATLYLRMASKQIAKNNE